MVSFLLVDDRNGRVLAEFANAQQAARVLAGQACNAHGDRQVSVVRLNHQRGSLSDVTSMVSMRPLSPLMERRARTKASPDRPSQRPPSTRRPRA